ncbi:plasmid replication initiator protein [Sphingomonas sp. Leaf67]|uniref:replication initiator protein A n=1 Tax=Sphingomonas sp. Leaf67 TaxID=1736230 RepID=UPI0006FD03E5|nr:replication initiator protein A [Sphingomonas sp. Leaf67]KQN90373.1 plasmid replication initiator protein [Sphingomonas sp. Leaf67]
MTRATPEKIPEQFDLFLPYLADMPLRDQREMMERPFFSLAKTKRLKPIDYRSPDGKLWVHVSANADYGMATIWDADILIYCASVLADMARRGVNDVPRKLHLMPYDLLRAIGRPTTGRAYELLGQALDRLVATTIKTNIRAENRREATFSWLDGWTQLVDEKTERSRGMTIELSNWFWEGVMMTGGVLSIDRAYFDLTGGRERWLYRVARKHAGGAGEAGFAISMPTLFEKSGAEGQYRRFKFEIAKIAERNELPGYSLTLEQPVDKREPLLRMRRRAGGAARTTVVGAPPAPAPVATPAPSPERTEELVDAAALIRASIRGLANRATQGEITPQTLSLLRNECPGWDYQTLHAEFRAWIEADSTRTPVSYQAAFIGYVRRWDAQHRHELGR